MMNRLKTKDTFGDIKKDKKIGKLLLMIKAVSNEFQADLPLIDALEAEAKLHAYRPGPHENNA